MINKVYEKIKQFMKNNWKYLIIYLALYLLLSFPVPYYIYVGGGIINIDNRIALQTKKSTKGSLNFAYVKELRGNLSNFFIAHLIPGWDIEKEEAYKIGDNETIEDIEFRNHIYLEAANQTATLLAYQKAGKKVDMKDTHYYVLYVDEKEKNGLQVGDEILKVEGEKIENIERYTDYVSQKEVGDSLSVLVLRKGKEKEVHSKIKDYDGKKLTGVSITTIYEYETDPKISFQFKNSESGPSGGLMLTLAIYNQLIKGDITHGLKIVGTGTIEKDGSVGEIGGVKYKLKGAVKNKADIFLVPKGDNYKEAMKEKKKHHYSIKIKEIETLDDAIQFLEKEKSR